MKLLVLTACFFMQIYIASSKSSLCTSAKTTLAYTSCLKDSFDDAKDSFLSGRPEYNIPPLNPYKQEKLFYQQAIPGVLDLKGLFTNVEIHGFDAVQLKSLSVNHKLHHGGANFFLPYLTIKSNYALVGKLLNRNMNDSGSFEIYLKNIDVKSTSTYKFVDREGIKYPQFEKISFKFSVGSGNAKLRSQDPELQFIADLALQVFNNNPQPILAGFYNTFGEIVNGAFVKVGNDIFDTLPAEEVVPLQYLI